MSLIREDEILHIAKKANTAVIAFICLDYNMVKAVIDSAEKNRVPAIIMLLPEHVTSKKIANFNGFAAMVKGMAEKSSAILALHLDHSYDEQEVFCAIDSGFTSVMFDASREDLDINIERVKNVVKYAHRHGVVVESELGAVGIAKDISPQSTDYYTKPEAVERFVNETAVDSLAISIGNAHGDYPFKPKLDLELLDKIRAITDIPLVLHGGSGIPDEQLEQAFSRGINKFNYGTDVLNCYDSAIREFHKEHEPSRSLDILDMPYYVQKKMSALIDKKMKLCRFN